MAILEDKVIVVTDAPEGIGRTLCLALANQRPKLVIGARNEDRLEELKKQLESAGAKALVVPIGKTYCSRPHRQGGTKSNPTGKIVKVATGVGPG